MSGTQLPVLTDDERSVLLSLARTAVLARVRGQAPPEIASLPRRLTEPQGAFVTLRIGGELHGCIGVVEPEGPLAETIVCCAEGAAHEDPRFSPMTVAETEHLEIEISVLHTPFAIDASESIEPGRHGVIVSRGRKHGLLLPQVATEHGWDRETLLRQTCRKAGLAPDAWRHGARVMAFEAEVFSEASIEAPPSSPLPSPSGRR